MFGSSYLDLALGLVRGIWVMNLVGPTGRGIMRLVDLAHRYLTHSHLGILHGVTKELPQAIGRADIEGADQIERVGTTYVTATGIAAGLGLFIFGCVGDYGGSTRASLMAGGGILVTQQVFALYRCIFRAWGRFPVLAASGVVNSVAQFVFIILGAMLYHVSGAMLGWLLGTVITIGYLWFACRLVVPVDFNWRVASRLLMAGLPIAVIIFSDTLLRTVDGLVVAASYPGKAYYFGLYTVAMQMSTYLYRIPEAGGFVIMPRILEKYASDGDVRGVRRQVMLPTIAAATIMPVAAGCAFVLLPPLIRSVVPKFEGSIYAAQVLSLASVLLALPMAANSLLVALNREMFVVLNKLAGAAVIYLLARYWVTHDASLAMIAMGAGVGYFVAGLLALIEVLGRYYPNRVHMLTQLALCYLPLLWCAAALKGSGMLLESAADPMMSGWSVALLRLAIFLVASAPVLWYGNRRTLIFQQVRSVVRRTISKFRRGEGG